MKAFMVSDHEGNQHAILADNIKHIEHVPGKPGRKARPAQPAREAKPGVPANTIHPGHPGEPPVEAQEAKPAESGIPDEPASAIIHQREGDSIKVNMPVADLVSMINR